MANESVSGQNAKEIGRLILHSPALLIAGLVGVAIVAYMIIKNGPSKSLPTATGTSTPPAATGSNASGGSGQGYYVIMDEHPAPVNNISITGTPITTTTPTVMTTETGTIRGKEGPGQVTAGYDAAVPSGIPIRSGPGGNASIIGNAGYGSNVKVTGNAVTGTNNFGDGNTSGSTLWYPVTYSGGTGYVSAYDISALTP